MSSCLYFCVLYIIPIVKQIHSKVRAKFNVLFRFRIQPNQNPKLTDSHTPSPHRTCKYNKIKIILKNILCVLCGYHSHFSW